MSNTERPAVATHDDAPLAVQMLYPGDFWDEDSQAKEEATIAEIEESLDGADIALVVDSDADGRGVEVVIREAYAGTDKSIAAINAGHREDVSIAEAGEYIAEHAPDVEQVIVADLCPNEGEEDAFVDAYEEFADDRLVICDHHDWSSLDTDAIGAVADIIVNPEQCATQIVLDEFYADAPDYLQEFADVTADHDLWIKEDERSNDLSDFSFWADCERYVAACREHGADIMDDPETAEFVEARRAEKEAKIRIAVEGPTDDERVEVREFFAQYLEEQTDVDEVPEPLLDELVAEGAVDTDDLDVELNDQLADAAEELAYNDSPDWYELDFDSVDIDVPLEWYADNYEGDPSPNRVITTADETAVPLDIFNALLDGDDVTASDVDDDESAETVSVKTKMLDALARGEYDPAAYADGRVTMESEVVDALVSDEDKQVVVTIEGPLTVAMMYGSVYASGAGDTAQKAGADVAIVVPPWNKASIRSRTDVPIAKTLASQLNGGGHPPAAGCQPNVAGADGFVEYDDHWNSRGQAAKAYIMNEFMGLVDAEGVTPVGVGGETAEADDSQATAQAD